MALESPSDSSKRAVWRAYLLVLTIVVGAIIGLQLANLRLVSPETTTAGPDPVGSLLAGDLYVKQALVAPPGASPDASARAAISQYKDALPWPEAYRRIALVKQSIL